MQRERGWVSREGSFLPTWENGVWILCTVQTWDLSPSCTQKSDTSPSDTKWPSGLHAGSHGGDLKAMPGVGETMFSVDAKWLPIWARRVANGGCATVSLWLFQRIIGWLFSFCFLSLCHWSSGKSNDRGFRPASSPVLFLVASDSWLLEPFH